MAGGGWLHALGIRVDPASGQSELTLCGKDARVPRTLVTRLAQMGTVNSVVLCVSPMRSSYPLDGTFKVLSGARRMRFSVSGTEFSLSPETFFQTSAEGVELLVKHVLQLLPSRMRTLADLYGGAGIFSILSRRRWRHAVVVEQSPAAMEDLSRMVKVQGISGITHLRGRVEERLPQVLNKAPDAVILDPPRRGCHPRVMALLVRSQVPLIIYVACSLEAFMRDAATLLGAGYQLDQVRAVDMFPHTPHLEVVGRFSSAACAHEKQLS